MRIKLMVGDERYAAIESELIAKGFILDDAADLILSEKDLFVSHLITRSIGGNERIRLEIDEIIFIESCGKDILIHTQNSQFRADERLYQLERLLNPEAFLRISYSVIVARNKIKKIKPALSSKFILTMSNGKTVDVTRSYYNIFRDSFGI